jgi:hypothetical protein
MTPRLATIAVFERMSQSREDRGWLAWTTAVLGRINLKKFPKLEDVAGTRAKPRRKKSWQQLLAVARAWASAEERRGKKRRKASAEEAE